MKVSSFLWQHSKKVRKLLFGTLIIFFLSFSLSRYSTWISSRLVGFIAEATPQTIDRDKFLTLLGTLMISMLLSSLCMYFTHLLNARFRPRFISNINRELFKQTISHSSSFFSDEMTGTITSKFGKTTDNAINLFNYYGEFVRIFATFSITIGMIAFMNFRLAAFYLLTSSLFIYITFKNRQALTEAARKTSELEGLAKGVLGDTLNNASTVKAFSNIKYEGKYLFHSMKSWLKFSFKADIGRALTIYKNNSMFDILSIIFYLSVFYTWYSAGLSVADVVFIISSIAILSSNVKEFSYSSVWFLRFWGELKENLEFIYREHEVKDAPNAIRLKIKNADINIDEIDFKYRNKDTLFHKFSLKISNGEKIGLVGRSGSGKSTLIKLLARYYDLNNGEITIDGKDISKVTQDSLRRNIAMIPQDTTLFNRTILENIRYSSNKASEEEVIEAAKKAYCHEFITQLPNGYNSKVGERGVMLSGGERQRIAIARAILQNAPILILDEATSALDSESEQYIQKALKQLMKEKTVIAIAHRLSTLKEMDRIVVMENGKIIEDGSQKDLLAAKGAFYNFYKMQSEGFLTME